MRKLVFPAIALCLVVLLSSWGYQGHYKISDKMSASLPQSMGFFKPAWVSYVADHCSDADYRKDTDPNEESKHYIDIDNYPEFNLNGYIPQYFDSILMYHGLSWVLDEGILPWSTLAAYDSLKAAFSRADWNKSAQIAADLGHYVGDGHMPLHITRNFDGQYTGQSGAHSRYESKMINRYVSQILYEPDAAEYLHNVRGFIFSYLYYNYQFKDSILLADDYSYMVNGSYSSGHFSDTLWSKTKNFTIPLFAHASYALASIIYTAWVDAGSPVLFPNGIEESMITEGSGFDHIYPNPAHGPVHISILTSPPGSSFSLTLYNSSGKLIERIAEGTFRHDKFETIWNPVGLDAGVYHCVLKSGRNISSRKIVVIP